MVRGYQEAALQTRLGIPLLYGADAVHGHSNVRGAVAFPHNIGLGASRDASLVKRIGRITALEALVAAWLPGTEGDGVAQVLFGAYPFTGTLPHAWPRSMDQVPRKEGDDPLFPFGYGLS